MRILIENAEVYINHNFIKSPLILENGKIECIGDAVNEKAENTEIDIIQEGRSRNHPGAIDTDSYDVVYDLDGMRLVPGFIDIHTHGAVGVDVNAATAEDLERICRFFASQGTTGWLESILTDTEAQTLWCIDEHVRWKSVEHRGSNILGIHMEGPFLSTEYKGAMPEHLLKLTPDRELVEAYQKRAGGHIRYMTVSPELDGIVDFIPELKAMGIQVAIGHSGADYETSMAAIDKGAMASTHTGNAMKLLHQHFPAIFGAVLEADDVYCEVICDGRHLHPGTVRLILKTKGLDRVAAITDSIMAAGLPDGAYKLGVNDVVVVDGDARLKSNGVRAGSTLTTIQALKNLLKFTGRSLEDLLPLLTENPARLIGVFDRKGSIGEGKDADLVVLDANNDISQVFVGGVSVFSR